MLVAILDLIGNKEGFWIRVCFALFCTIISGGFYSSVFPFVAAGIHGILFLLVIGCVCIALSFLARSLSEDSYHSKSQSVALIITIAVILLLIGSLFSVGVFIAS